MMGGGLSAREENVFYVCSLCCAVLSKKKITGVCQRERVCVCVCVALVHLTHCLGGGE